MRESEIEKAVNAYAISRGWVPIKFTSPNLQGVPDQIYIGFGEKVLFIEFKQSNGKLSKNQIRVANKFRLRGVQVHVIDNIEDGKELVDVNT